MGSACEGKTKRSATRKARQPSHLVHFSGAAAVKALQHSALELGPGNGAEAKFALVVLFFSLPASPPLFDLRFKQKAAPDTAANMGLIEHYVPGTITFNISFNPHTDLVK